MNKELGPIVIDTKSVPTYHQIQLTRREIFAAMAMQAMIINGRTHNHEAVSKYGVGVADALILELDKSGSK